jgi:hypothetical protein
MQNAALRLGRIIPHSAARGIGVGREGEALFRAMAARPFVGRAVVG